MQQKTGIKVKGSVEMLLQAQPTKGVQIHWLLFSIFIFPPLHTRYLRVNNDCLLLKKSFLSLFNQLLSEAPRPKSLQVASTAGPVMLMWSVLHLPLDGAAWSPHCWMIWAAAPLTTADIGQRHTFCVWTTAHPVMVIKEDVPCAKSKSSDTVAFIFLLCHRRSPPWAGVTLPAPVPLAGQPEHIPRAVHTPHQRYWPKVFHGCLDNRDLERVSYYIKLS